MVLPALPQNLNVSQSASTGPAVSSATIGNTTFGGGGINYMVLAVVGLAAFFMFSQQPRRKKKGK